MVEITAAPIDTQAVVHRVMCDRAGAVVLFLGTTRAWTGTRQTMSLSYECYERMACQKMEQLRDEALRRWPLQACALVHRVGDVPVGQSSVAIAVSAPHRSDAFAAGEWLIDSLKESVPIWKREAYADGTTEWVHPGIDPKDAFRCQGSPS